METQVNIKAMTTEQLKAIAYDQIELAEKCRANILTVQAELKARENVAPVSPPPEPPLEVK